ncbi:PREDICTED: uncharacterized protein LOC109479652 [Branchiostoma belcheri]|uniref:Uncharacterized protein LOC109479652 n=1 Tax=Branchiostoma belcheri TaxID=7741 RepID=A0A6P4ZK81_BRABE|nr:PREDICTED: uncharacterized protein LOC109479652 [Branchiostoma belcheri]
MCCIRLRASCCGCCSLRTGSIVIGVLHLVLSLVAGGDYVYRWIQAMGNGVTSSEEVIIGVAVFGVSVLAAVLLIIGAAHNNSTLCLIWVVWAGLHLALVIALAIYAGVVTFVLAVTPEDTTGFMGLVQILTISLLVVAVLIIAVLSYGIVVVCSHYRDLKESPEVRSTPYEMQFV